MKKMDNHIENLAKIIFFNDGRLEYGLCLYALFCMFICIVIRIFNRHYV